jgi:mRNA interferase MazF
MLHNKFEIWSANLNPRMGTEPGKVRPVVIIQSDLLNEYHPSTIICPITTNVELKSDILRVHLKKGEAGLNKNSDILVDQLRAIDNTRFKKCIGILNKKSKLKLIENLKIVLDLI